MNARTLFRVMPLALAFLLLAGGCSRHEPDPAGSPAAAPPSPKPANFAIGAFSDDVNGNGAAGNIDDIKNIVHDGAAKHGGWPLMAPWPMPSPQQIRAIAEYAKSLHGGRRVAAA